MAPKTGMLYVTMKPSESLSADQFHDWYNNEHGPMRLRFPFFVNGFRYRATDLAGSGGSLPEWLAIYDVTDMEEMVKQPYVGLRQPPVQSQRERDTMKQIKVDRKFFDFVDKRQSDVFKPLEDVAAEGESNALISESHSIYPGKEEEYTKWFFADHIASLSTVPGWLRSRLFVTASIEGKDELEYLALHDFTPNNGLNATQHSQNSLVKDEKRRAYELFYTIGPAQRDLSHIYCPIVSTCGRIREHPKAETQGSAIESYITTNDGVPLPYRLEGSTDPQAPLILLSNSILVDYSIWDGFVSAFLSKPENKKYRIVRYLSRGRFAASGNQPITVDLLASDIISILDALRVPKAAAIIGVSLGGATTLNVALNYPNRVASIISCDTSAKSPAGNSKAWGERIALSQAQGAKSASGEAIVGDELAEITTLRWFVKENYDEPNMAAKFESVKQIVANNSFDGFEKGVQALYDYDMTPLLEKSSVRTAFFVGARDGVLPQSMKNLAASTGKGAKFVEIDGAGHLPMVEKPEQFAEAISEFLLEQ